VARLDPQYLTDQQILQMLRAVRVEAEQDQLGARGHDENDADHRLLQFGEAALAP